MFFVSRGAAEDARIADEVRAALFTRLRLTAAHVLPVPRDEFPRTPAGKVRRTELRDRLIGGGFDTGTTPDVSAQADPDAVTRVVREELGAALGRPVDADLPFYELGLTSVLLVRMWTRLEERIGTRIAQTAFFEHPTAAAHLSDSAAVEAGPLPADTAPADTTDQRIAVIGLSLRFPGADSAERFWANLRDGVDSVRVFGEEELAAASLTSEQRRAPGLVPVAGVLDGVEEFDIEFFGMSPKEAELTHPAHRLFLECCTRLWRRAGTGPPNQAPRSGCSRARA
ncbi:beta-ketoacyl synthase N-terminal-like domain-containing protein [Streptomyces sp. NPDC091290]|uniref:beta-ketoacyl synthase N-terminal-like domain-containing protein n=1 Tax=Streptomyces sp. NPDC091290 TaxID=3365990 RepID=UPI0038135244